MSVRYRQVRAAAFGFERGRVDDSCQAAAKALVDDQVEHLERILAGTLVVLNSADHGAQSIRRDDRVRVKPVRRPM